MVDTDINLFILFRRCCMLICDRAVKIVEQYLSSFDIVCHCVWCGGVLQAARRYAARKLSGTPLSVLDPQGSPTIEYTYEK